MAENSEVAGVVLGESTKVVVEPAVVSGEVYDKPAVYIYAVLGDPCAAVVTVKHFVVHRYIIQYSRIVVKFYLVIISGDKKKRRAPER